jgi:predicted tellurium resistance membrane protein TerC
MDSSQIFALLPVLLQVLMIDLVLAGDNAVVIGLAVAGAARQHPAVLAVGLLVSVGLMGIAASLVARLLTRFRWLAWVGLGIVLYVSLTMIYAGSFQVLNHVSHP